MLKQEIRIHCPVVDDEYAQVKVKEALQVCLSIGGNCKACPYAIITKGFVFIKKLKTTCEEHTKCGSCS